MNSFSVRSMRLLCLLAFGFASGLVGCSSMSVQGGGAGSSGGLPSGSTGSHGSPGSTGASGAGQQSAAGGTAGASGAGPQAGASAGSIGGTLPMSGGGAQSGSPQSGAAKAGQKDGQQDGQKDGQKDGAKDGQKDGPKDGQKGGKGAETSGAGGVAGVAAQQGIANTSGDGAGPGNRGTDPEAVFNKSLGDFDGQLSRERAGMASNGKGAARGAEQREAGDARAVKTSGLGRTGAGADSGGTAGDVGGAAGADVGGSKSAAGAGGAAAAGGKAGVGQNQVKNDSAGAPSNADPGGQDKPKSALPPDIPADGTGEDQVARQIREAALAEQDPRIREALWSEYRRQMGIKKK